MKRTDGTTIWVHPDTKANLDSAGKRGESYDDIIRRLLQKRGRAK